MGPVMGDMFPVNRVRRPEATTLAGGVFIFAWIGWLAGPSLRFRFGPDEMMNIYYYWSRGPEALIRGLVDFPSTYYRPLGGLYYWLLFELFGLDPLPYHVVLLALMMLNTYLAWRVVRALGGCRLVAGLTSLAFSYHRETAGAYFAGSYVYDVLCCTFWMLALAYYISVRRGRAPLAGRHMAAFLGLYICALDAKEMAVSLPVVVLAYELIFHLPRPVSLAFSSAWLRASAAAPLASAGLTAVYIYGKLTGQDSLIQDPGYRPLLTPQQYWGWMGRFAASVAYLPGSIGPVALFLSAALLLLAVWLLRTRGLGLAVVIVAVSPLPIAFIDRGGPELLIPYFGCCWIASGIAVAAGAMVGRRRVLQFLPTRALRYGLVCLVVLLLGRLTWHHAKFIRASRVAYGARTWYAITQVEAVQPKVKAGARALFLNDPFPGFWDMKFIAELVWRDHEARVSLEQQQHPSAADVARFDYVFEFRRGLLMRLSGPGGAGRGGAGSVSRTPAPGSPSTGEDSGAGSSR